MINSEATEEVINNESANFTGCNTASTTPVSYTHLDVYKRQYDHFDLITSILLTYQFVQG